jgi:hypothetical protein
MFVPGGPTSLQTFSGSTQGFNDQCKSTTVLGCSSFIMINEEVDAETYIKRTLILSMIGGNHEGQQGRLSVDLSLRSIHFWFDT